MSKSTQIDTRGSFSDNFYYAGQPEEEYYPGEEEGEYYEQVDRAFDVDRGFGPQFEKSVDSLMNRVANQVIFIEVFIKSCHCLMEDSRWSTALHLPVQTNPKTVHGQK